MSVTLEVSKLSGWLNADAYCRGSKGGAGHTQSDGRYAVRNIVHGGREVAVQAACRAVLDCTSGGRARGGAHVEHGVHGCEAVGVEAQRLVERRRELPRVGRRAYGVGRAAARVEAGGGG